MRVLAFPKGTSAYTECFYAAVEALGVPVVAGVLSGGWLRAHVRRGDWMHLHWPSFEYASAAGKASQLWHFARFVALLLFARALGARLAWTAHNLLPHDRAAIPALDVLGRRAVILLSDVVFVHGPQACRVITAHFRAAGRKAVSIPHGHWIGHYPQPASRAEARRALDLPPASTVFAFVGLCKPYKNVDGLLRAFRTVDGDAVLLIAGRFQDARYEALVRALAADDRRVRIDAGFIPDDRLGAYLVAADVIVAPYREILTSGTAMLAMSFGRPLVSVAQGFLLDVVDTAGGVLYGVDDPAGLANALAEVRTRTFDETVIIEKARALSFDAAAARFVAALRERSGAPSAQRDGAAQ